MCLSDLSVFQEHLSYTTIPCQLLTADLYPHWAISVWQKRKAHQEMMLLQASSTKVAIGQISLMKGTLQPQPTLYPAPNAYFRTKNQAGFSLSRIQSWEQSHGEEFTRPPLQRSAQNKAGLTWIPEEWGVGMKGVVPTRKSEEFSSKYYFHTKHWVDPTLVKLRGQKPSYTSWPHKNRHFIYLRPASRAFHPCPFPCITYQNRIALICIRKGRVTAETLTVLPKPQEIDSLGHERCPHKSQYKILTVRPVYCYSGSSLAA